MQYLFMLALLLGATSTFAECSKTLRYAQPDWPPYAFKTPTPEGHGIDVDILLAAAAKAGCKVEVLTELPGGRSHKMFQHGQLDVVTGYSFTEERREFARYTRPYRLEVLGVFSIKKDIQPDAVATFDDVLSKGYYLVAPLSGYYGAAYAEVEPVLIERRKLSKVAGAERALRMLAINRGDLVMDDANVLQYTAKTLGLGTLQKMKLEPSRDVVHIGLSKTSTTEQDFKAIDKALERLLANGTIAKITRRYSEKSR